VVAGSRAARWVLALLAAISIAIALDNLERPLANPDEGRYSEISREMALSGDWVTPRLDGIKYFEKPPLQYWATALAFDVLGTTEPAARLYVFLAGFFTLLIVGYTGLRLMGAEAALASMLALVASPYFMGMGGIVTLDMGLTLWTTATVCAFLIAEDPRTGPRSRRGWLALAWAAMALAVLSKGLIGIIFAGAAVFFQALVKRDIGVIRRMGWLYGIPIFLAIAAPWFVLVARANPEFAHFFFVHEHFERFLTTEHRRVEPWWYFLPIVVFGFLPWVFALPAALAHAWRSDPLERSRPLRVALLWSAFVIAFFSASGSKLPAYVLPVFPMLALAYGRYLSEAPPRRLAVWSALAIVLALALAIAAWRAPGGAREPWMRDMYYAARPWLVGGVLMFAAGCAAATWLLARGRRWIALTAVAMGAVLMIDGLEDAYERFSPRQSGLVVAQAMEPWLKPGTRLYSVNHYEQSVPFYIGRTMILVNYRDEFQTGLDAEPGQALWDIEDFEDEWLRPGEALAIMQPGTFERFRRLGLPMEVLHEDPRRVLVRKP
jgi:4-amino-4-deoxy-L-arabinose transferase-like glycosyltransferase